MADELRQHAVIDRLLHEPNRLIIVAILYPVVSADFLFLLRETGLTKGNLSAHIGKLEEAGYLLVEKTFRGKTPQTILSLTARGREAFLAYRQQLKETVERLPE